MAQLKAVSRHTSEIGQHGQSILEATSALADPNNPDGTYKYVANEPVADYAQRALTLAQKRFYKDSPELEADRAFHKWSVRKVMRDVKPRTARGQ